jgi:type IV pilus assembly protein PilB
MAVVPMTQDRGAKPSRSSGAAVRRMPLLPVRVRDAFGEALIAQHLLTPTALQSAIQQSVKDGSPLHETVVTLGFVEEEISYSLLANTAKIPFHTQDIEPNPLAVKLVPAKLARRHELVPIAVDDKTIKYLTATPYDVDADRDLSFATGRAPSAVIARRSRVRQALEQSYPDVAPAASARVVAATSKPADTRDPLPGDSSSDSAIVNLCHTMLARAIDAGASDLQLDPVPEGLLVQIRVAGSLEKAMSIPSDLVSAVVNRFKVLARVATAVRNRPQEGTFSTQIGARRIEVRLTTLPTTTGEKLVVRVIDKEGDLPTLETLGLDADTLARLKRALDQPSGLVLVGGPAGCGKTTTIYAALQYLRTRRTNVVSVEDPIERTIPGINQLSVNTRTGATVASTLRTIIKQYPEVVMVGDVHEREIAEIVGAAVDAGCLVLGTMRTQESASAVAQLMHLGLQPYRVAEMLRVAVVQRLVRRACSACRTATASEGEMVAACAQCRSTGFVGRVPIVELLAPTDAIRTSIGRGETLIQLRYAIETAGIRSLRDHGAALVASGLTTQDELVRVLGADALEQPVRAVTRRSVLIADDEPITRTLVKLLLERDGFSVMEAHNGREAVDLAVRHTPSLIVMDLNMPEMDGYEAISEIRHVDGLQHTPIVVVTTEDGPAIAQQVLALGADDYILKPFEPSVLTARVKAAFSRQHMAA